MEEEDIIFDIRQKKCWEFYINPKSDSYGNAKESAIKAGYTVSSALQIKSTDWFKTRMRRLNLLSRAEKVLKKTLDMVTFDESTGKEQADLLRVQNDAAKFVAKTLGKDEGYSERTEVTGKDGDQIVFMPVELMEKYNLEARKEEEINK